MRICSGVSACSSMSYFDAVVGERAGGVEAERLEVAGEHLHRGDAAVLAWPRRTRPGRRTGSRRRPRGRDAGRRRGSRPSSRRSPRHRATRASGKRVLQAEAGEALLRRVSDVAALALAAGGIGHGVRLVEDDDAVEIRCPASRGSARGGTPCPRASGGAQRRVGGEQDAFGEADRRALPEAARAAR